MGVPTEIMCAKPVLLAREAMITTASVTVKALTLSKKQMTLSTFRQLQSEDLIDESTGMLNGVAWGYVNYFWGECSPDHLHVIWQKDDELRRDCVYPSPKRGMTLEDRDDLELATKHWILKEVVAGNHFGHGFDGRNIKIPVKHVHGLEQPKRKLTCDLRENKDPYTPCDSRTVTVGAFTVVLRLDDIASSLISGDSWTEDDYQQHGYSEEMVREHQEKYAKRLQDWREALNFLEAEDGADVVAFDDLFARMIHRQDVWQKSYDAVADTDQLFIAV